MDVLEEVAKALKEKMTKAEHKILLGNLSEADYKSQTGYLKGLRDAYEALENVQLRLKKELSSGHYSNRYPG